MPEVTWWTLMYTFNQLLSVYLSFSSYREYVIFARRLYLYTTKKKKGQIRSHTRYTRAVDFLTILKIVVLCVQCLCTISKKYIQVCKCILTIIVWPRSRNLCKLYVYLCGRTFNKWTCVGTHYTWIPNNILCLQY